MNGTERKPDKSARRNLSYLFKLQYYQPVPVKFVNQIQMLLAVRKGKGVKMHQGV